MSKGTPTLGKRARAKLHIACRRCGKNSFHKKKKICSSCGFGKTTKRKTNAWAFKRKDKR